MAEFDEVLLSQMSIGWSQISMNIQKSPRTPAEQPGGGRCCSCLQDRYSEATSGSF